MSRAGLRRLRKVFRAMVSLNDVAGCLISKTPPSILRLRAVLHDKRERSLENHLSSFVPHSYDKGPLVSIREFIARHIRKAPGCLGFGCCKVLKLNSLVVRQEQVAIIGIEEVAGHRHSGSG